MNIFLNLNLEHSLNWIYWKTERIERGLKDRAKAIKDYLGAPLHDKINRRGQIEQGYVFNGCAPDAKKRQCRGTFYKGNVLHSKYHN